MPETLRRLNQTTLYGKQKKHGKLKGRHIKSMAGSSKLCAGLFLYVAMPAAQTHNNLIAFARRTAAFLLVTFSFMKMLFK